MTTLSPETKRFFFLCVLKKMLCSHRHSVKNYAFSNVSTARCCCSCQSVTHFSFLEQIDKNCIVHKFQEFTPHEECEGGKGYLIICQS